MAGACAGDHVEEVGAVLDTRRPHYIPEDPPPASLAGDVVVVEDGEFHIVDEGCQPHLENGDDARLAAPLLLRIPLPIFLSRSYLKFDTLLFLSPA